MFAFIILLAVCGAVFPIHAAPTTDPPRTAEGYVLFAGLDFEISESQAVEAFYYVRDMRNAHEVRANAKQNVSQLLLTMEKFVNSSFSNVYDGFALIEEEMKPDGFDYCYEILTIHRESIQAIVVEDIPDIRCRLLKVLDNMEVYHSEMEVALDKYKEVFDLLLSSVGCFEGLFNHYDETIPRNTPTVPEWDEKFEVVKRFFLN
uniref:SXP/RAL-2 family protein Ani s 5-like cation-binding domain-containing protein n=1 Tax=Panagrellus redivivus TaxID=6233 RepID=A0A7E4W3G9_PANRE